MKTPTKRKAVAPPPPRPSVKPNYTRLTLRSLFGRINGIEFTIGVLAGGDASAEWKLARARDQLVHVREELLSEFFGRLQDAGL